MPNIVRGIATRTYLHGNALHLIDERGQVFFRRRAAQIVAIGQEIYLRVDEHVGQNVLQHFGDCVE